MEKQNNKDFTRVNINLPTYLVNSVKNYANEEGFNITTAYIVLLKKGLEDTSLTKVLPELFSVISNLNENNNITKNGDTVSK